MAGGVGERDIDAAGAREFGIDLDGVADIGHEQERRAALGGGQGADIALGLVLGANHGLVPAFGAADAVAGLDVAVIRALLGLQHEVAALVEVDAAEADGAVAVGEADGLFEDVGVQRVIRKGGMRRLDLKFYAEFAQEYLELARSAAPVSSQRFMNASIIV